MTLRVNAAKSSAQAYLHALAESGVSARIEGEATVVLDKPVPVQRLPGFADGVVSVQDAAAQMAAPLLLKGLPTSGKLRILDACAAPGGKTCHLLELVDAEVIALEIDARRAKRITENLDRLGLQAQVVPADALNPASWWDGEPFDAILLDAPCTASGIVRRHPDVRWLRRESDIAQLAALQKKMLGTLWGLLRPGGRMLYCTCSLFLQEGDQQLQTFLTHNTDATLLPSPGHLLPLSAGNSDHLPDNLSHDHDGFYYALLQKRAT
jgi:16S rRNA (cytosine967-C5)-methyltransferase